MALVLNGSGTIQSDDITLSGNANVTGTMTSTGAFTSTGVLTSSAGIYLGGTASANLLDDYEEGTWTPTVTAQSGTLGSYTLTNCKYVRIGQLVNIMGKVKVTSVGTGSDALRLSLPFVTTNVDFSGSGAERTTLGYQCAVFGENTGLNIRKYDFTTVINLDHEIKFSATYLIN